ncbi:hypothetical protein AB1Y20_003912 [Prymnesium parvum]|uniref:Major facilitator superfamily (MFS) profile domain-containing protein n=1 Tax=Prymnesium parvum TaxID=97485 RepID=A0AB34J6A2_PRYPA
MGCRPIGASGTASEPCLPSARCERVSGSPTLTRALLRTALPPVACGLALGCTYGNIGGVLVSAAFTQRYASPPDAVLQALGASVQGGGVLGSILGGWLADSCGRRRSMLLAAALFVIGTAMCALAAVLPSSSLAPLFAGRALTGIAAGVLCAVTPLHVSESAIAEWRGGVEASFEVGIETGILLAYVFNYLSFGTSWGWILSLAMPLVPGFAFLLLLLFVIDESPRYLSQQGELEHARRVLSQLRTAQHDIAAELLAMGSDENALRPAGSWRELVAPSHRGVVAVAVLVLALQVGTGIDIFTTYAPIIFARISSAGATGDGGDGRSDLLYTILVGCILCVVSPLSIGLVDRYGRRPLLLVGAGGMSASLLGLAVAYGQLTADAGALRGVCVTFVLLFVAFFSFSWGPIAWVIPSELLPIHLRARAVAAGTVANWIADYLVVSTFLSLADAVSYEGAWALYCAINTIAFGFVIFFVKETKGLELEQISSHLARLDGSGRAAQRC